MMRKQAATVRGKTRLSHCWRRTWRAGRSMDVSTDTVLGRLRAQPNLLGTSSLQWSKVQSYLRREGWAECPAELKTIKGLKTCSWKQTRETSRTMPCCQAGHHRAVLEATPLLKYVWCSTFSKGEESGRMMLGLCAPEFHRRLMSLVLSWVANGASRRKGSHHVMVV